MLLSIDFIAKFAGPLPAHVIMNMLGVPPDELARVKRISADMALFIGSSRMPPEKYELAEAATREMAELFRPLIAARRAERQNQPSAIRFGCIDKLCRLLAGHLPAGEHQHPRMAP